MNRVLSAIVTFIYMMFFTNISFAKKYSPEESLEITFINKTDYSCAADAYLKHGQWDKKPPKSIPKHSTANWIVYQSVVWGPDLRIKFTCGGYSFSTKNQQNYCAFKAGNQHYSTSGVDRHLTVTNKQTRHAAYAYDGIKLSGKAAIVVSSKGRQLGVE